MAERLLTSEVEQGLEERGLEAVRALLAMAPPGPGSLVPGLQGSGVSAWISRSDAEFWVQRKDEERAATQARENATAARRDASRFWWNLVISCVGTIAAIMAAVEGWLSLRR